MKPKRRATPEATPPLAECLTSFLEDWKLEQEKRIAQAREALSAANTMLIALEEDLKELA